MVTLDEFIQSVMVQHYQGCPIEFRLSKVFQMEEKEKKKLGVEGNVYVFWGFISLPHYQPDFLFGQITIDKETKWGYRRTVFGEWAKKARQKGWFDRKDVREECISAV